MLQWIGITLLFILTPLSLSGQGVPFIHHYDSETIDSHPQNWAITQDSTGYLYFGSQAEYIQRFDGVKWVKIRIAGTGAIRSFHIFNSKIHWGGVGNIGYVDRDSLGADNFGIYPLKSKIDSTHRVFNDVWQMLEFDGQLYHRTSEALLILEQDTIKVVESDKRIRGVFKVNDELWVQREDIGLNRLINNQWVDVPGAESFADDRLVAILPYSDYHLLIFRNYGFVKYEGGRFSNISTEADSYFDEHSLYRAIPINDSDIALAFLNGGILLVKYDGTIQNILTEENGLPTNIIYDIYKDSEQTLWATSSNGIIKILPNNPLTNLGKENGLKGSIKFIEPLDDVVYIGTASGLFIIENGNEIHKHPGIDESVYDGIKLNGTLYVSFPSGLFQFKKNSFKKIDEEGVYRRLEVPRNSKQIFLGARQNSIDQITVREQSIERSEVFSSESEIRQFFVGVDGIWVLTYHNEVFFNSWSDSKLKTYIPEIDSENSTIRNISSIDKKIRLATDAGLYVYDTPSDSFLPDTSFNLYTSASHNSSIVPSQVFQFEQCSEDEIWFRSGGQTKRAIRRNDSWEIIEKPYRLIGNGSSIQEIQCNPDGSVWFGGSEGVFHLSDPDWTYDYDFNTNITGVLMRNDSLIYGGYGDSQQIPAFKYADNELRFTYAAASYIEPEANTYRVRLRGYDDGWSNWSEETQKDYTFIPEGTYTFEVQGRNVYEKEGSIDTYTFTILPPWYRTIWAYLGYLILAGGVIYGAYRVRINRILREQQIRDGIARDLHDELSSTLSSINFFADAINSRKLGEKENNRFLSLITKSSKEAKEKVSDIVWVIHSENDDWENLLLRCKRFAADMLDSRNIKHNFKVEGNFSGGPTITERKNIWLIFREILTNIARHADCLNVNISFKMKSGRLDIRISDDGKGFDMENKRSDGYGLQNIKERAEQLNGETELQSTPGEGTSWSIQVPLK